MTSLRLTGRLLPLVRRMPDREVPAQGRLLGVDLGSKRIGVATCDAGRVLASPLTVVQRSGSTVRDHEELRRLAFEEEVVAMVVGLPVDLRGKRGVAAEKAIAEVEQLRASMSLPVALVDERFTTALATKRLREGGMRTREMKSRVDAAAAATLLQSWIDLSGTTRTPS